MKNEIQNLQSNIEQHAVKNSPLLRAILQSFRESSQEISDLDFIPGSYYSFCPDDVTQEDMDTLFHCLISSDKLLSSNEDLVANIITHIASFSLDHFVNELASKLLNPTNETLQFIATKVSRIILDPTTGFLCNSARQPLNNCWLEEEEGHHFDFFNAESADRLNTPFGIALDKFRQMIFDHTQGYLASDDLISEKAAEYGFFVPSLFVAVQTAVIPPSFRMVDIACGFPSRTEVLLAFSKFQDQVVYSKNRDLNFKMSQTAVEWSGAFSSLFKTQPVQSQSTIKLFTGIDCSRNLYMRFAKLILFLNIGVSVQVPEHIFHYFMKYILGGSAPEASFNLMLTQALLFIYPEFSFPLFDDILGLIDNSMHLSIEQKFTFEFAITRFIDVLSLLPTRYIDDNQMEKISILTIIGLCSPNIEIRYISFKVVRSLGSFESTNENLNLDQFIQQNANNFEQFLFNAYENNPRSILSHEKLQVLSPLHFKEAMLSHDCLLWQYYVSAMGLFISQQYLDTYRLLIKKYGYEHLRFMQNQNNVHLLTFLSSLADTPQMDSPEDEESLQITQSIIYEMIRTTKEKIENDSVSLYIMISQLHVSSFSLCIDLLSENFEPKTIAIFLYSMAWNPNFISITENNEDFFAKFVELFLKVCDSVSSKELMEITLDEFLECHKELIQQENEFLCNILSCFYQILNALFQHYSVHFEAPFPCADFVVDTEIPQIKQTQRLFTFVYNLVNAESSKQVHFYAIKTLEMWFACNLLDDLTFLISEHFLEQLPFLAAESPNILLHLLSHHFDVLFSIFLENAMQPGGECFFYAIASFFRAPSLSADILPLDILRTQWNACKFPYSEASLTRYLQALYENCGTFILCCLFYMIIPNTDLNDKAFITLSSITPVLLLFHMKGRKDTVLPLIESYVQICDQTGQSLSCFDVQTIGHLSESICEHFQFCMEQLIFNMFTNLPKFDTIVIDRILYILMPWFATIQFDIENRVISKETDLLFIRFSCFSFVEMFMSAFGDIANDDINSSLFSVWRTLATEDGAPGPNFLSIVVSMLYLVSSTRYHNSAYIIIRYMYRISPQTIVDILSSYLSFNFYANQSYLESLNDDQVSDMNSIFSGGFEDDDSLASSRKSDSTVVDFILMTLSQLAHESVRPLVPSLPVIFCYCIVNLDKHFDLIHNLLSSVMTELQPYLETSNIPYLQEVLRLTSSLPTFYPAVTGLVGEELFLGELKLSQTIPYTDRTEISRAITHFFQSLSSDIATSFGIEMLKWGLCCSDLYRGSFAMLCYRGNLLQSNALLIGLISRTIWTSFDAITFLYDEKKDRSSLITPYARYISECFKTLLSLSAVLMSNGTIGANPSLFWMAVEGTHCNVSSLAPIFDSALSLLEYLLYPELFGYINGKSDYMPIHYTPGMFTKYHTPWGDVFHGCARAIFEYHGPSPDIQTMIRVINYLVQTSYPIIFMESEHWGYIALLSLLPWIWSVIITDVSRFFFSSPAVQMMEATTAALSQFIQDQEVLDFLSILMSDEEIDIFSEIAKVCNFMIPFIPMDDLVLVANFFTNCLKFGGKTLKMPLYSVVTHMLSCAADKQVMARTFAQFTELVSNDTKLSRKTYVKMYFTAYEQASSVSSSPQTSPSLPKPSNNEATLPHTSNNKFNESSKLIGKVLPADTSLDPEVFPNFPIFERIVAVEVPHMYDFTPTEAQAITFNELNSFPPLYPFDQNLAQCPKFHALKGILKYVRCEPFSSWTELISKLHTSLIETENVEITQRFEHLGHITVDKIIIDIIDEIKKVDAVETEEMDEAQQQQQLQQQQQQQQMMAENDQGFMEDDPFSFIFMRPDMFVPTVEEANYIGTELFGEEMNYS